MKKEAIVTATKKAAIEKKVTEAMLVIFDRGSKDDDLAISVGEWLGFIAETGTYVPHPQGIVDVKFTRAAETLSEYFREHGVPEILSNWFINVSNMTRSRETEINYRETSSASESFTITTPDLSTPATFVGSIELPDCPPLGDDLDFDELTHDDTGPRLIRALGRGDEDEAREVIGSAGYGMRDSISFKLKERLSRMSDRPDAMPAVISQAGTAMWSGCRAVIVRGFAYVNARGHVNIFKVQGAANGSMS